MKRWHPVVASLGIALSVTAAAQTQPEQRNMELVGHDALQARSAYQPVIHRQGDRWIAYVGHHGGVQPNPGLHIVQLTGPARRVANLP